jgi:6-phosphogluconolactonase (cycloisomerase 2 family)
MKFSKLSQLFLVSSIGLLVATVLTACQIVTIDYVYVATAAGSSSNGSIQTFAVDSDSGALRTGATTISSGGTTPVAMAISSDYANLYVANSGSKIVAHFTINMNGVPKAADSITLTSAPVALAVDSTSTYLYVVTGGDAPALTSYSLAKGVIGSVAAQQALNLGGNYANDMLIPTGITVLANNSTVSGNAVYVSAYDQSSYNPGGTASCTSNCANPGWVFGYSIGTGGALTASHNSPYQAGVRPSGIVSAPSNRFVYVTDYAQNHLIGYQIINLGTLNTLSYMTNGPFTTGNEPSSVAIDPRGTFLYVTNALDSSVTSYSIDITGGTPTIAVNTSGASVNATETYPVAIAVDPALGRYVYTANYLANSLSGFRLDSTSGALTATQSTPYPSGQEPTALVIIPHGNHALPTVAQ